MGEIKIIARNKSMLRDYSVLEELECGIVLKGTEIKSIRKGHVSVKEAYCRVINGTLIILNMHIAAYDHGNIFNHEEKRDRILLATSKEIAKWGQRVKTEGLTIIPMTVYLKGGLAKIGIGLCRGKKRFDKREDLKKETVRRQMEKSRKFTEKRM